MRAYFIKNISDTPALLEFDDGSFSEVQPRSHFIWRGPDINVSILQEYVDRGHLSVWIFGDDFSSEEIKRRFSAQSDWTTEGF
jgi:hypothetical protein